MHRPVISSNSEAACFHERWDPMDAAMLAHQAKQQNLCATAQAYL